MGAMGSYSPSHGSIGIPSPRCTSYSHGSIGNQQSRCTSYHHGSIGIRSYRCTSYVSASPFGFCAKRWFEYGASGSGGATNQVCCQTGRRKAFRLCQLIEVGINVGPGEGHMVQLPRARLLLLLEVHQILVGLSRSWLGTNFRQHRRAVYHRKNMQL